jgi:Protein of unknown function (DUF551)
MSEWISVKDRSRRPPSEKVVYILRGGEVDYPYAAIYSGVESPSWFSNDMKCDQFRIDDVTHWMPIPESPLHNYPKPADEPPLPKNRWGNTVTVVGGLRLGSAFTDLQDAIDRLEDKVEQITKQSLADTMRATILEHKYMNHKHEFWYSEGQGECRSWTHSPCSEDE